MTTPDEQTDPRRVRSPRTLRGCGGLFFLVTLCFAAFWGAGLGVFVHILASVEETIEALEDFRPKVGSKLFSADGAELGEFKIEPRQLGTTCLREVGMRIGDAAVRAGEMIRIQNAPTPESGVLGDSALDPDAVRTERTGKHPRPQVGYPVREGR